MPLDGCQTEGVRTSGSVSTADQASMQGLYEVDLEMGRDFIMLNCVFVLQVVIVNYKQTCFGLESITQGQVAHGLLWGFIGWRHLYELPVLVCQVK